MTPTLLLHALSGMALAAEPTEAPAATTDTAAVSSAPASQDAVADDTAAPPAEAPAAEPTRGPPPGAPDRRPPPGAGGGAPGGPKYRAPAPAEPPPGGGQMKRSPIHPYALLQIWGTAYDMDVSAQGDATGYGDPEDDIGFKLKRGRMGLVYEDNGFEGRLIAGVAAPYDGLDTKNGEFGVYEASLGYRHDGLGVVAGLTEVPFSRDSMMSSGALTFQERGLAAEHIAPYKQVGVVGGLDTHGVGVKAGVFNSGGGLYGDDNAGKTFVGRAEYTVGERDVYRMWDGDDGGFGLGVGGGGFYTMDVATSTMAVGGDFLLRAGGLSLLGDGSYAKITPTHSDVETPDVYADTTRIGVTGQVSYGIDAFEPAVRVSWFDDSAVGSFTQLLAGMEWHGAVGPREDLVAIGVGYEMRLESGDAIPNDTARLWAQFWLPAKDPPKPDRHPPRPGGPTGGPRTSRPPGGAPPEPNAGG